MFFSAMIAAAFMLADTTPAAAPAAAPAPAAAAAPAAAPAKAEKPKLICKSEPVIGSLMPKKTCYTEDQMSQRRQDERQNLENLQSRSH